MIAKILAGGLVALVALTAFPIMWLWNWLVPVIFGLPQITFWQALGLHVLARCFMPVSTTTS